MFRGSSARFRSVWFRLVRLGSARFGSVRLGSARFGSVPFGSARLRLVTLGYAWLRPVTLGYARLRSVALGSGWTRRTTQTRIEAKQEQSKSKARAKQEQSKSRARAKQGNGGEKKSMSSSSVGAAVTSFDRDRARHDANLDFVWEEWPETNPLLNTAEVEYEQRETDNDARDDAEVTTIDYDPGTGGNNPCTHMGPTYVHLAGCPLPIHLMVKYGLAPKVLEGKMLPALAPRDAKLPRYTKAYVVRVSFDSMMFESLVVDIRLNHMDPRDPVSPSQAPMPPAFSVDVHTVARRVRKDTARWYENPRCRVDFAAHLDMHEPMAAALPCYFYAWPAFDEYCQLSTSERARVLGYEHCYTDDGVRVFKWMSNVVEETQRHMMNTVKYTAQMTGPQCAEEGIVSGAGMTPPYTPLSTPAAAYADDE